MSKSADTLDALFEAAKAAQAHAYAPYSHFKVGAAIRTPDGAMFSGCNVENAAYPQGACAEAGAIGAMALAGRRRIAEILVVGDGEGLCTPCGGCRQRIREFADAATPIHVAGPRGRAREFHARANCCRIRSGPSIWRGEGRGRCPWALSRSATVRSKVSAPLASPLAGGVIASAMTDEGVARSATALYVRDGGNRNGNARVRGA